MNSKAIAKSTAGLAVIVIILVAGLAGTVFYYSSRPPTGPSTSMTTASVPTPAFVGTNTYVAEGGNQFQWLDPAVSYYQYDYEILNDQFEKLLWYNGNSSTAIIPWLAYRLFPSNANAIRLPPTPEHHLPRWNTIQCESCLVQFEPALDN